MTWAKLADDFYDHPKVLAAGPAATYLWICSIAYANRYLTDGVIPAGAVRKLADADDPSRLANRLVEVGLWERVDGGYAIHDFAEYQPSADAVREEREANRDRVRTWRERQKSGRSNGVTYGVSTGSPYPDPVPDLNPDPAMSPSPQPPPSQAREGEHGSTNQRRRSRSQGVTTTAPLQREVPADLTPPTEADRALWSEARDRLTDGWLPSNAEKAAAFEPLGRDPSGWLWIRAPAWAASVASQPQLAACLVNAGDPFGQGCVLVEG